MYEPPEERVRFGDIFETPFLFDVHVAADATSIPQYDLPPNLAKALGKALMLPEGLPPGSLPLHSPLFPPRAQQDFVRAHGGSHLAVLVSDNCTISDMFGYERERAKRSGRLIFAPIAQVTPSELDTVKAQGNYERFPLDPGIGFGGGVVELRRVFMADKRALEPGQRITTLNPDMKELLEVRWAAYAARRGPAVFNRNAIKLATLLSGGGSPTAQATGAAAQVAEVLALTWRLEGSDLENAATAADDGTPLEPAVDALIERLSEIADAATAARQHLETYATAP